MPFRDLESIDLGEFVRRQRAHTSPWGFVHIPKTAGTSLAAALASAYGPYYNIAPLKYSDDAVEHRTHMWAAVRDFIFNQEIRPNDLKYKLFSGHLHRHYVDVIREKLPDTRLFTYLRDPVDRVVSDYRYCLTPTHPLNEATRNEFKSIIEFASSRKHCNAMTKYLVGRGDFPDDEIIDFVSTRFDFIGTSEKFDDSNKILSAILDIPPIKMRNLNVTQSTSENKVELSDEVRRAIRELNHQDALLYEYVSRVLDKRLIDIEKSLPAAPAADGGKKATGAGAQAATLIRTGPSNTPPDDEPVEPLFILGAVRSGTSVMLRLCREILGYEGGTEGHVWQSVRALDDHFTRVDQAQSHFGEAAVAGFSVTKISRGQLVAGYVDALLSLHKKTYGSKSFIDKTPGPEAIRAALSLKAQMPSAKFIFMKRRGIENVQSQLRRFAGCSFEVACSTWARPMRQWLEVRESLAPNCMEVDQADLDREPAMVAAQLCDFIGRGAPEAVEKFLRERFPEKTKAGDYGDYIALGNTGWDDTQMQLFSEICGEMMGAYGYAMSGATGVAVGEQIDLAARPTCARWRVSSGNRWIHVQGPGLDLHPNELGKPSPTLRMVRALEPGRYRFEGEAVVHDPRCRPQRLVMSVSGDAEPSEWSLPLDGAHIGRHPWRIASVEIREPSDLVLEVVLDPSSPDGAYSATRLISAIFFRL
jgi:hypothetical protein